ncbi:MAG: hypothetical protein ACLSCW_06745 [Gemmiger formicilis]
MLFLTGCAAGAVSSAAVPSTAAPLPGTAETAGTAEAAATPAPTADAVQPPQGLVETGAAVLDYDEIRLIDYFREYQPYPDTDYYTMCRDGKWGLMRSDGTEVLPCRASEPLFECSWNAHHWHGYLDDLFGSPDYEAAYKAASQTLTESGDGRLCAEHDGGGYRQFVCLQDDKTYLYSGEHGAWPVHYAHRRHPAAVQRQRQRPCARAERHHHARKRRMVQLRRRRAVRVSLPEQRCSQQFCIHRG